MRQQTGGMLVLFFFFFITLVTGPRRSLSLKLSDTRDYEPEIRCWCAVCGSRRAGRDHGAAHSTWRPRQSGLQLSSFSFFIFFLPCHLSSFSFVLALSLVFLCRCLSRSLPPCLSSPHCLFFFSALSLSFSFAFPLCLSFSLPRSQCITSPLSLSSGEARAECTANPLETRKVRISNVGLLILYCGWSRAQGFP